ncbi:MAG TPA: M56 family metallopeptidase [Candidatus Polarisedimenticolia bacterium]|nr:M56 family metallopeptidase [Candidatus Polarisedimenticolia bacterium]
MFALRGIAVSLTFFVVLYCLLSLMVGLGWRSLKLLHKKSERSLANLLFGLRILPVAASALITLGLVVPSFQLLEPRSIEEDMGLMPIVLGLCTLLLITFGVFRVVTAQTRASRVVALWMNGASLHIVETDVVTFHSRPDVPPLTLVGVCKPRVLVSESTISLLSREELRIALKHEVAHLRSCDNLKKLVFRFFSFPGMAKLESAWSQAAELAADDAAVSNAKEAVDLAAALVKVSRLVLVESAPACTVGFLTGTIRDRVARLVTWDEVIRSKEVQSHRWYAIAPAGAALLCVFATYVPALTVTHQITEWIVR